MEFTVGRTVSLVASNYISDISAGYSAPSPDVAPHVIKGTEVQ